METTNPNHGARTMKAIDHAKQILAFLRLANRWPNARIWAGKGEVRIYSNASYSVATRRGLDKQTSKRFVTIADDGTVSGRDASFVTDWAVVGRDRLERLEAEREELSAVVTREAEVLAKLIELLGETEARSICKENRNRLHAIESQIKIATA